MKKKVLIRAVASIMAGLMLLASVDDFSSPVMAAENEVVVMASEEAEYIEEEAEEDTEKDTEKDLLATVSEEDIPEAASLENAAEDTEAVSSLNGKKDEDWKYFKYSGTKITGVEAIYVNETSFYIPDDCTEIDDEAFKECKDLVSVEISSKSKLKKIGKKAFKNLRKLESIDLPEKLTTIEKEAFKNTGLKEVDMPYGLTEIDESVFEDTYQLGKVVFSDALKTIDKNAFKNSAVKAIDLPATVEVIAENAFEGAESLESLTVADGSKLKAISQECFTDCISLRKLVLPDSLEIIGKKAFYGDKSLKNLGVPATVKKIKESAFGRCGIETVSFNALALEECGASVFADCKIKTITFNPSSTYIPAGIFEDAGFDGATITIPSKVTEIRENAFRNTVSVNAVIFQGDSVKTIGKNAFNGASFKEIALPNSLKVIDEGAFANNSKLEYITLPSKTQEIRTYAFLNCTSLKAVYIPKSVYRIDVSSAKRLPFDGCPEGLTFYVINKSDAATWAKNYGVSPAPNKDDPRYFENNGFKYVITQEIVYTTGKNSINNAKNPGSYVAGEDIVLYNPERPGYTFKGWKVGKTEYTPDALGKTTISGKTKTVKVKALWQANTYTVTYDMNGGSGLTKLVKNYSIKKNCKGKTPKKKGYVFKGWYLGDVKANTLKKGVYYGGDITLVAKWVPATFTIKFDGNGADSGSMDSLVVTYGDMNVTIPECKFEKKGYQFVCWKVGEKRVAPGTEAALLYKKGEITLVAQWDEVNK